MSGSAKIFWLSAYAGTMAVIVWLTVIAREQVVASLSTSEAAREWDEWRRAAQDQANKGPVARRPPKTAEPPALIVMRDSFPAVLVAVVAFGTFLFAILFVAGQSLWPASRELHGSIKMGESGEPHI